MIRACICAFCLCLTLIFWACHVCVLWRQEAVPSGFSSGDVLIPLADEYDPMFPNDYEKVVKRHREERQRQREQERQKEIEEREKYWHACLLCSKQTGIKHERILCRFITRNDLICHWIRINWTVDSFHLDGCRVWLLVIM